MNCEHAIELISARIDGELSPADEAALEAHLARCPACAATAEAFELQDADLRHAFDERRHQAGTVAERVADRLPRPAAAAGRWKHLRRRARPFLFGATLAAALVGLAWFLAVHSNPPVVPPPPAPGAEPFDGLTARAKPAVPEPQKLAVGDSVTTKPGERRRVALPDGSVLYVNQGTQVTLDKDRHLTLSAGEVFVEARSMSLRDGVGPFVVQTPQREVTAVGTKFAVQAAGRTSVLVTQGYVLASGHDGVIPAGSELSADGTVTDAPRASYLLDWTRDLMAEADTPLVPGSEYGGGALVAVDPYGQQAKLSLRKYQVDVHIEDGFARTTIDQTYFNHANSRLEGTFYFPLPPDASLSRLAMYVDGKRMEGGMVERDFGRQVYEKIVTSQRDPALLEWVDGSTFKMRVFPLEARKEKRIILSYTQRLPADYGRMTYRFPAGHSLEVVRDWSFHAVVKGGAGLGADSPSHPEMRAERAGTDLILNAADHNVAVNRDVVLHLTDDKAPLAPRGRGVGGEGVADVARFSGAEADGNRYLMLRYRPALDARHEQSAEPRTWVFLFESSGDRDPLLARTQIEVVRALLNNAEHGDNFAILCAGTNVRAFAPEAKPVTPENVQAGLDFLDKAHLIGALDMGKALAEAEPLLKAAKNPYLVHVGTGVAAMGEKRDDILVKRIPAGTRYVGVGVGRRWNRAFMKAAAERSGGYFTQINPDEPVSWRGFELYAALTAPRLLDVTVTDDAGRRLLTCANSITAGEEVCAALRLDGDDPHPPQSVKVTGSLDGAPFERVLPVHDVAGGAGYIPRTWAKLEIDRLLAEDAAKNREQVVELSKAMYVMTPFTSLLVLENEQMYREHKVDRGRKDHWAMYPCPDTIKVVYEPDENSPRDTNQAGDQKPTEQQVLQTIQVRIPPRCIYWPNAANGPGGPVVTALQLYGEASPATRLGRGERSGSHVFYRTSGDAGIDPDESPDSNVARLGDAYVPVDLFAAQGLQAALRLPEPAPVADDKPPAPIPSPRKAARLKNHGRTPIFPPVQAPPRAGRPPSEDSPVLMMDGSVRHLGFALGNRWDEALDTGKPMEPPIQFPISGTAVARDNVLFRQLPDTLGVGRPFTYTSGESALKGNSKADFDGEMLGEIDGRWVMETVTKTDPAHPPRPRFVRFADAIDRLLGSGGEPRLYSRPSFSGDERVFTDLASYAPGMNTSLADVRAVLEAEAAPRLSDQPGPIDPAARKLIDRARSAGWQKLTVKGKDGKPALTITFDGAGRYAYQRTLANGLQERVVCDGRTLLHLYPDLGIGARRTVSRFHRADFAGAVPWLVPPAEDLAHGTEVAAPDAHTVAVSPRGAAAAKDDDGRPVRYVRLLMAFGDDGRLTERRLVLMPKGDTLVRETYAADGTVKRLDGKDQELATARHELAAADAPDLKPDTAALVVLPLPLRTREVVYRKLELNPNQALFAGENACHAYLNEDAALELFAADYAAQNPGYARTVYESCFAQDAARVPGFHVLLASCGDRTPRSPQLQALRTDEKHKRDPLLLYLTLLNLPENARWQPYLGLDLESGFCKDHPFLGPLAAFGDQWLVWRTWGQVDAGEPWGGWFRERQRRGLEFVRSHRGTAFAWALLTRLDEGTVRSDARFHAELADAYGLFADHPALGYAARYERARALLHAGKRDAARTEFREMFARAIKAGVLPAVDATFREALQGDEKEADLWTDEMRQTAAAFCKDHRRPGAVALAWQCWQLGDQPLASNLLAAALDNIADDDERVLTTLAAVGFLYQTGQHADADTRLRPLLEDKDLAGQPALWRMAGRVADARGQTARSVECLERALALEYRDLPDVINLEEVRRDYGRLLEHYQSLARAVTALKIDPPRDLLAKTVRAADCWRALDRDEAGRPCDEAAAILRSLGAPELAWEYQTTPIANRPNESGPWLNLAQSLQREGDFALADRAFAAAFDAEPTNPQILWDRAQALRQAGQQAEARKMLRQIAEGDWQPRFAWVRSQAKWQLEGK
jgi:ferric-dicitrate binding protein FerR (iron transport regulator)/tetratricopeptide (TPR) repeat protein